MLAAALLALPAVAQGRVRDADGDGLADRFEVRKSHTHPKRADTDGDKLSDGFEVRRSRTSPRRRDTDRDKLSDGYEVRRSKTSPRRRDTDGDGATDAVELFLGMDPLAAPGPSRGLIPGEPLIAAALPSPVQEPAPVPAQEPETPAPPPPPPDQLPPDTTIASGPSGETGSVSASFSFSSSEPGSTFQCSIDGGAWGSCTSPKSYFGLANGPHGFEVRATDQAGNTDPTPAARAWTVEVAASDDCDRSATPSTFGSEVSAATAGQAICLSSGAYGSWGGTSKAITIRPQDGGTATMSLNLSGSSDGNFTIDGGRDTFSATTGLTITGAGISGAVHDVTIENSRFTGGVKFLSHPHPNVVLDHNEHVGIPAGDTAAIHLPGGSDVHSGVTVKNSLFRDMEADGVQTGPAIDILDNEFARMGLGGSAAHTDMIQLYCGCGDPGVGSLVKGNFIHDGEQGIGAFDGAGSSRIEDNVIVDMNVHHLVLGGDDPGSVVQHNTIAGTGNFRRIDCSSKSGFPASLTFIRNNIAPQGIQRVGGVNCQPSENRNNMQASGASGLNFIGTAQFVGGQNPTTYEGYRLAPGSPGKDAASDGSDVGIR